MSAGVDTGVGVGGIIGSIVGAGACVLGRTMAADG